MQGKRVQFISGGQRKRPPQNEQGIILLSLVFILFFLSILLGAAMMRSQSHMRSSDVVRSDVQAFAAAEAGVDRVVVELRRNPNWGVDPNSGLWDPDRTAATETLQDAQSPSQPVGSYSLRLADGGPVNGFPSLWVRSTGQDPDGQVTRTIDARLIVVNPTEFLVSTSGDLFVTSGARIEDDILGYDVKFIVTDPDQPITVADNNGDPADDPVVFFFHNVEGDEHESVHLAQQPKQIDPVPFAGVDLQRYREDARLAIDTGTGIYFNGDAAVDLGSLAETTQIIYAEGNISVTGQYTHSLIVVAEDNVYITGDIEPDTQQAVRPQIGILASGDVIIPASANAGGDTFTIEAFVMADGQESADGVFRAEGLHEATLKFFGSMAVRGDKNETAVDLNAFANREYTFNEALSRDRQIPYLPFMSRAIEWRQTEPHVGFPPS